MKFKFTPTEWVLCVAIAGVTSFIFYPILMSLKNEWRVMGSKKNLQRIHAAMLIYQIDYGVSDASGLVAEKFPADPYQIESTLAVPQTIWTAGCQFTNPLFDVGNLKYVWLSPHDEHIARDVEKFGKKMTYLADLSCNNKPWRVDETMQSRRCIGITYEGEIRDVVERGDVFTSRFWLPGNNGR